MTSSFCTDEFTKIDSVARAQARVFLRQIYGLDLKTNVEDFRRIINSCELPKGLTLSGFEVDPHAFMKEAERLVDIATLEEMSEMLTVPQKAYFSYMRGLRVEGRLPFWASSFFYFLEQHGSFSSAFYTELQQRRDGRLS